MRRKGLVAALLVLWAGLAVASQPEMRVSPGDPFPDFAFDELSDSAGYGSLGLPRSTGPFRLSEIPGNLLVLEFFNALCLNCQRQAPLLESFFQAVSGGDLSGRVRLLSVGVGNRMKDLEAFRRSLKVSYPMAADPDFDRYLELGDPGGTPLTLFLVKDEKGWKLADAHMGVQGDAELVARSRVLLEGRTAAAFAKAKGRPTTAGSAPGASPEEGQLVRIREFLSGIAGQQVSVTPIEAGAGGRVYRAVGRDGNPLDLYARSASREAICDLCHSVRFLFAFDANGKVRGYESVHVTKFGNELWSREDDARLSARLNGRSMEGLSFDPHVDAVTSATMSSSLIFDEVRRTAALMKQLPPQ